jgi:hypothetical protein
MNIYTLYDSYDVSRLPFICSGNNCLFIPYLLYGRIEETINQLDAGWSKEILPTYAPIATIQSTSENFLQTLQQEYPELFL